MRLFRDDIHPLQHRLWVWGSWVGLFVSIIVINQTFVRLTEQSHRLELGGDFVPAYVAGTLVRKGRAPELYKPELVAGLERKVVGEADLEPLPFYGPYLNPPFFAAAFASVSALPYRQAALVWLCFNLACAVGAIVLLCRMLPARVGWRAWGLVPLLVIISMPFIQAICHLQNTCLSLLLLCGVVWQWRAARSRPLAAVVAGMLAGLLSYKPQLTCLVAMLLVLTIGWRALLGLCVTGSVLLALTIWKLPGALAAYLHELPRAIASIQARPTYNWGRQVTPHAFWRLLIRGHGGGPAQPPVIFLSYVTAVVLALGLAACVWAYWRRRDEFSLDRLIAATIASMPLLMPYYMDYDLLLMAVPVVLLARDWMDTAAMSSGGDRFLFRAWAGLFVVLYVNPGLSGHSRMNLAAPMVACVGALLILRCLQSGGSRATAVECEASSPALAA